MRHSSNACPLVCFLGEYCSIVRYSFSILFPVSTFDESLIAVNVLVVASYPAVAAHSNTYLTLNYSTGEKAYESATGLMRSAILAILSMKPYKSFNDPGAMELLGDETRRRIIYLLRARDLTLSQVAEELKMTPQAVYHHIRRLLKAHMIEVEREERVGNFIEKYYRATAEVFQFSMGTPSKKQGETTQRRLREALRSLPRIGINIEFTDSSISNLSRIQARLGTMDQRKDLEDRISRLDDVDFMIRQELTSLAQILLMTDKQFQEWIDLQKALRKELASLLPKDTNNPLNASERRLEERRQHDVL